MFDENHFSFQLPCFVLADRWTSLPNDTIAEDGNLQLVTVKLDLSEYLLVFTDQDLADTYVERVPHNGEWRTLGLAGPTAMRKALAVAGQKCSHVVFDKNPAVAAGRTTPISVILAILDQDPLPPIRDEPQ